MSRGGKRDGAGRKRGTPNRANAARQAEAAASGLLPVDQHLFRMRYHHDRAAQELGQEVPDRDKVKTELALADEAAKNAAPYVHNKLATVEHTGKDGGAIQYEAVIVIPSNARD